MCVLLSIIKINELLCDYFGYDIYDTFLNGYCLEYYEILKLLYPEGKLVIEKNGEHCACLIDGNVYDVTGICDNDSFFVANKRDIDFVYSFYNRFDEKLKDSISKYILGNSKVIKK